MPKFDEVWIANRKLYRKNLKGTRLTTCPYTGYLEPVGRSGFTADRRKTFIERFRICSNLKQVTESVGLTVQSVYDAIAVDKKFRDDMNACYEISGRAKQLNNELERLKNVEKNQVISDLRDKIDKYR